jgi:monoamine oxidase
MSTGNFDVIIIGGGICGLTLAEKLAPAKKILVLEARERLGGRINTLHGVFSLPVDAGAEFIHGQGKLTKKFIKKAKTGTVVPDGRFYQSYKGKVIKAPEISEDIKPVLAQLGELKKDIPFGTFLEKYVPAEEEETRLMLRNLAEGFDAADVSRLSSFAVRDEWQNAFEESAFVKGGHGRIIDWLTEKCLKTGCHLKFPAVVKKVTWKQGSVRVRCHDGSVYSAGKAVITVPLGVLLSKRSNDASIVFEPAIPQIKAAVKMMGYGGVIKVIFEFRDTFWAQKKYSKESAYAPHLLFLFCDGAFPTWWTPIPGHPFLTAWAGGPKAASMRGKKEKDIREAAIGSLCGALHLSKAFFDSMLVKAHVEDWTSDPFAQGAYSYPTVDTRLAERAVSKPLKKTLYFAGEAFAGKESGTVEAAIASAFHTVSLLT